MDEFINDSSLSAVAGGFAQANVSVRTIAEAMQVEKKDILKRAINAALDWRYEFIKINAHLEDGKTTLVRALENEELSLVTLEQMILKVANPYFKDSQDISGWDLVKHPSTPFQSRIRTQIIESTFLSQYGHYDAKTSQRASKSYDEFRIKATREYRFLSQELCPIEITPEEGIASTRKFRISLNQTRDLGGACEEKESDEYSNRPK